MNGIFEQLQQGQGGLSSLDLVDFSPTESQVMRLFLRHGRLSLAQVTARSSLDEVTVRSMLDEFVQGGVLRAFQVDGEQHYCPRLARKRRNKVPSNVWALLNE
jgi:uncharacterized protein (DUF2252 family)